MLGTPWSDGTPGMSQKPIEIGQSFVYRFKASPAGTHWYHSHSRATVLDGLYGPIFIRYGQNNLLSNMFVLTNGLDASQMLRHHGISLAKKRLISML
jgi:FtsP/CotA-like multicopper oxidase with cupredoxin domain